MPLVTPGAFTMSALTSEVTNDPLGLGYGPVAGQNPDTTANLLNTAPEPVAPASQEQIYRKWTETAELIAGIVQADFTGLTVANREFATVLFSQREMKTGDANLRTQLGSLFPAGSTSRANMNAAAQRNASRAEALWGDGFSVTAQQVYTALGRV